MSQKTQGSEPIEHETSIAGSLPSKTLPVGVKDSESAGCSTEDEACNFLTYIVFDHVNDAVSINNLYMTTMSRSRSHRTAMQGSNLIKVLEDIQSSVVKTLEMNEPFPSSEQVIQIDEEGHIVSDKRNCRTLVSKLLKNHDSGYTV